MKTLPLSSESKPTQANVLLLYQQMVSVLYVTLSEVPARLNEAASPEVRFHVEVSQQTCLSIQVC